jgi:hypothetical protein
MHIRQAGRELVTQATRSGRIVTESLLMNLALFPAESDRIARMAVAQK